MAYQLQAPPNARPNYPFPGHDLAPVLAGARALLRGADPYAAVGPGAPTPWPTPPLYPATTMLLTAPLAGLSLPVAAAVFVGLGFALATYALSREGLGALIPLFSYPAFMAVLTVQWSPYLVAAALLPWLSAIYAGKPTTGAAFWVGWPTRTAVAAGLVLLAASIALRPDWPLRWTHMLGHTLWAGAIWGDRPVSDYYLAPVARTAGFLLPLAWLKWRRPEARLLGALALIPQSLLWYEMLPLVSLVPQRTRERLAFAVGTWVVAVGTSRGRLPTWHAVVASQATLLVLCIYLPSLALVLTRPNEGPAPAWLARAWAWVRRRAARDTDAAGPAAFTS